MNAEVDPPTKRPEVDSPRNFSLLYGPIGNGNNQKENKQYDEKREDKLELIQWF